MSARVTPLRIPAQLLRVAIETLRAFGTVDTESIVLLLGRRSEGLATVHTTVLPEAPGVIRSAGYVKLTELWMLRLTECCELLSEVVLAQMHAHPSRGDHSDVDDHHLLHAPGVLSIVLPGYALGTGAWSQQAWTTYVGIRGGLFAPSDLPEPFEIGQSNGKILLLSERGWRDAPTR